MGKVLKKADLEEGASSEIGPPRAGWSLRSLLYALALLTTILLSFYALFRGMSLFNPDYTWVDRIFALLLFFAECFILIHGIGYFLSTVKAMKSYRLTKSSFFVPVQEPSVALIVAIFNEDPAILEDTLIAVTGQDYGNKTVYLLDDSTKKPLQEAAEGLAQKYGCVYVHRVNRRGYKAGAINDLLKNLTEKYMAVFDADQKPVYNFVKELIPLLEGDEKVAFVQTPQFYDKTEYSPVAFGAAQQQAVFYEYICEGKSSSEAMFCCGTNVILRTEALRSVGGFDESTVTEDFATSVRLHMKGWKSCYYNKVFVYGLGPETLAGYFTQQMRWAMGTLSVFKKIVAEFFRKPSALRPGQWWEYFMSGSYYFIGWANFIFIISPIAFLIFDIRPLIADPKIYLAAFLPYFVLSLNTFYLSMGRRGYRVRDLFIGQALGFSSFWILMNAAIVAMLGLKRAFGVTPKGAGGKIPLKYLWPQLTLLGLSLLAVGVGVFKAIVHEDPGLVMNIFWAAYNCLFLGMIFYFNRPFTGYTDAHIFKDWSEPSAPI